MRVLVEREVQRPGVLGVDAQAPQQLAAVQPLPRARGLGGEVHLQVRGVPQILLAGLGEVALVLGLEGLDVHRRHRDPLDRVEGLDALGPGRRSRIRSAPPARPQAERGPGTERGVSWTSPAGEGRREVLAKGKGTRILADVRQDLFPTVKKRGPGGPLRRRLRVCVRPTGSSLRTARGCRRTCRSRRARWPGGTGRRAPTGRRPGVDRFVVEERVEVQRAAAGPVVVELVRLGTSSAQLSLTAKLSAGTIVPGTTR